EKKIRGLYYPGAAPPVTEPDELAWKPPPPTTQPATNAGPCCGGKSRGMQVVRSPQPASSIPKENPCVKEPKPEASPNLANTPAAKSALPPNLALPPTPVWTTTPDKLLSEDWVTCL